MLVWYALSALVNIWFVSLSRAIPPYPRRISWYARTRHSKRVTCFELPPVFHPLILISFHDPFLASFTYPCIVGSIDSKWSREFRRPEKTLVPHTKQVVPCLLKVLQLESVRNKLNWAYLLHFQLSLDFFMNSEPIIRLSRALKTSIANSRLLSIVSWCIM